MPKSQVALNPESFTSFGELLRYLRERAHLSQRELAVLVGYHHSYVSYIEKNTRVPDEASLLGRFIPALGLENEPTWVRRLLKLAAGKPSISTREVEQNISEENFYKLPTSLTSMLGREREVALLTEILQRDEVRLVTIVGPPGVGKTCLALHIAEQALKTFTNGVVFVNLTPITQAELILTAIAAALDIQELAKVSIAEKLKTALRKKNLLIVIDNFEQVVDAAPQLIPLLGDAPGVKILATSREALRVRGEQEFPLTPLLDSPAVQLFIERARAVKPDFQLDEKTASHAAEICRRLDGLPLAIELAAARIQTLNLPVMLEQLDNRFEWLTRGGRDLPVWRQTLWGAIEWSYNLLSGQERALLNRLSVFAGGWTIEAAKVICSDDVLCAPSDIFNLLMQLVDKSLAVTDGERYHFLETLREFAQEKLKESNELERLNQSHCDYFLKFAQTVRSHLSQGGDQVRSLSQMELEHDNLRAALTWAIATPARAAIAMELGLAIERFWSTRGHLTEARRWLDKILSLDPAPTPVRADLLRHASDFASAQGEYNRAQAFEEEGLAISQMLEDNAGVYYSMDGLAMLAGMQGDYARAAELLEKALGYWRQTNDTPRLTTTLNNLAIATRRLGNVERAQQLYTESITVSKKVGNLKSLAHALNGLAEVHADLKKYDDAISLHRESLFIRHQLGDLRGMGVSFNSIAMSTERLGNSLLAVKLEGAAAKIRLELGVTISPATRAENEDFIKRLRAKLGDAAFENAWLDGQTMPLDQAVALAMESA